MKSEQDVKETLRQWILKKSTKISADDLSFETPLLESRIISSLHVMELILEIEKITQASRALRHFVRPFSLP